MSDFNSQSCVKCGKPSVFIPIQTTSLALCNDCYAESIRFKFRTTLAKTRLFPKGFNPTQTTPKVLVLFEWDSRARVMLQLINETNNQSDSKKRFTSYPTVSQISIHLMCLLIRLCLGLCSSYGQDED